MVRAFVVERSNDWAGCRGTKIVGSEQRVERVIRRMVDQGRIERIDIEIRPAVLLDADGSITIRPELRDVRTFVCTFVL